MQDITSSESPNEPSISSIVKSIHKEYLNIPNEKVFSFSPLLSPGRMALKNQHPSSPSMLKSPPVRTPNSSNTLLKSPSRINPILSTGESETVRRSPRLLSKLIQSMDIKSDVSNGNIRDTDSNPFLEPNNQKSEFMVSLEDKTYKNVISSSPQRPRPLVAVEFLDKTNAQVSVPVLLPTGKTPRATRTITFASTNEEDTSDENNLNLSNTVELFSPGFHGDIQSHSHYYPTSSIMQSSQVLTDSISDEFIEPSQLEVEFYQSEEYLDGIAYAASLPSISNLAPHPLYGMTPVLPSFSLEETKVTLVLDLDETLVHCSDEPMNPFDISFNISLPGRSQPLEVFVRWRPHLFSFLEQLKLRSKFIDVVLFTASQKIYARRVLSLMDPDGTIFNHSLFRESCRFLDGSFVKDLSILGRPLSKTILVDNSIQAYSLHPENGYAIPSWFEDPLDNELPRLLAFLDHLLSRYSAFPKQVDFRQIIRRRFPIYNSIVAFKESKDSDIAIPVETLVQLTV